MNINECKQALRDKGVKVDNISEATIQFLCDSFEGFDLGEPPKIDSLDPAERVKAGVKELDTYIASEGKAKIFDLISDAIEMASPKSNQITEDSNG